MVITEKTYTHTHYTHNINTQSNVTASAALGCVDHGGRGNRVGPSRVPPAASVAIAPPGPAGVRSRLTRWRGRRGRS